MLIYSVTSSVPTVTVGMYREVLVDMPLVLDTPNQGFGTRTDGMQNLNGILLPTTNL
ncbi:MAG: hypothetical protein AAF901_04655 [Bacteroidota bacterium]